MITCVSLFSTTHTSIDAVTITNIGTLTTRADFTATDALARFGLARKYSMPEKIIISAKRWRCVILRPNSSVLFKK